MEGAKEVCSLFSACVSVSVKGRGCDPGVGAKPLLRREAGELQCGGWNAEQRGEARTEHLGIGACWRGESRRKRIYRCHGGARELESFRSGITEREEAMAGSGMEKMGY